MKSAFMIFVSLSLVVLAVSTSGGWSGSPAITYTILVEAAGPANQEVDFTAAYAAYDENVDSKLMRLENRTPYETKVSGEYFLGMFQSKSRDAGIRVTLTKHENGELRGHANGSGKFNFLHGEPNGIGYGIPEFSDALRVSGSKIRDKQ